MKKKKKKKKGTTVIRVKNFLNMLKKVHLGGVFEECIIEVVKGSGKITAVDITNSMIVISKRRVMSKDVTENFGLGNLELLVKFLSSIEDEKMILKASNNQLTIKRKDSQRKLDYLLTQPGLIATRFQEDDDEESPYEKIDNMMEFSIALPESLTKDFLTYISLLKTKEIVLNYNSDTGLSFICGSSDDHQFELRPDTEVEERGDSESEEFSININGEHLSKIFSVIEFDEEEPPTLSFAEDKPIMIEEGGTAWVLVPIVDIEQGA